MNWKTIAFPRLMWIVFKRGRAIKLQLRRHLAGLLLRCGHPQSLSQFLKEHGLKGKIVLKKQGILSVAAEDVFLRFTERDKAISKMKSELAGWQHLRELGLGDIVAESMKLHTLPGGVVLEVSVLESISEVEQATITLPIIERLVAHANREVREPEGLPPTIDAAFRCINRAGQVPVGRLESEVRAAFKEPLRSGLSHQDLHLRNIMKTKTGKPILIDLKSCIDHQVLALDILNFACKYQAFRSGRNVIDQALVEHKEDWSNPDLAPALELVDLPRALWGPVYALHAMGRVLLKSDDPANPGRVVAQVVGRITETFDRK